MTVARHFASKREFYAENVPGSFHVERHEDETNKANFYYRCPCGCGASAPLYVGENFKPADYGPSWSWNGDFDKPTLSPSINHVNHWHGWLRDGIWSLA